MSEAESPYALSDHLEMVQQVVERHARNSFLVKGWSVAVVAAALLLIARGGEPSLAFVAALVPGICFWGLDAYYLRQERLFRSLFDHVRVTDLTRVEWFTLDASKVAGPVASWPRTLFAPTVLFFHLPLVSAAAAVLLRVASLK